MTEATAPTGTGDAGAAASTAPSSGGSAASGAPASGGAAPASAPTTATVGETAPSTPAAPAAPATLAQGAEPPAPPATAAAPTTDWRDRMAGGDKEYRKTLDRYQSEAEVGKAHREAVRKISEGAHKKPGPPENATPEQTAAWRKEAGIPESWEKYELKLPDGLVLGTEDGPVVDLFKQHAHKKGMSTADFNDHLGWYYATQDALRSMRTDADQQFAINAQDALRTEWGPDYKRNMNALGNFRDKMPEGLATRLLAGRLADGTLIGNDPQTIQWLVSLSLDLDPTATIVPPGTTNVGASIDSEIAEIEKLMRDPNNKHLYWKDEAKQKRYRELLEGRDRMKSRAA